MLSREMNTPHRSTAAAFLRYLTGEVVADSVSLKWTGLYARRWRLPRAVDRFLVPATPKPPISCNLRGMAEFRERDVGGEWMRRKIGAGDLFMTRSRTPYEVDFKSPPGEQLDNLSIHIAVEPFLTALEARYPGRANRVEVADYFGRDEVL
jgi:AraC family transcriptional regulator